MNLATCSARELGRLIAARKLTSVELIRHYLARIERWDREIHAFITLDANDALAQAKACDDELRRNGPRSPLHGIPVALKDMIDVTGVPTTFHSKLLLDNVAHADATCVRQLRDAGAIVFGKLATHEFALGGPSFDNAFPPARNPWDTSLHPGGSSSGAGAGLAAGFFPLAVGTDSGGSIRGPAAMCGIVGFKPTYLAVSDEGVLPVSPSVDHVGPMARTATDAALLFDVLRDRSRASDQPAEQPASIEGTRVAWLDGFHRDGCVPAIAAAQQRAADCLRSAGAQVDSVEAPPLAPMRAANQLIMAHECWQRYAGKILARPAAVSRTSRRRMLVGAFVGERDYAAARAVQVRVTRFFDALFERYDYVLCANSMALPCTIDDEAQLHATAALQARAPFCLSGHPAIALPAGFAPNGLPVSLQLAGRRAHDFALLAFAEAVETALAVTPRWPEPKDLHR